MTAKVVSSVWWRPVVVALFGTLARRMFLGCALAALTVVMGVGLLGLSGWFLSATAIAGLQLTTALTFDVFMPSAGIRLLALGRTASRYAERLVTHDATLATLVGLRERLFLGWGGAPSAEFRFGPARVLQRLTGDLDALESLFLRVLVPVVAACGAALFCVVIFGVIEPWFGVIFGLWLLVAGLCVPMALAVSARRSVIRKTFATERLRAQAIDLVSGQTDLLMAQRIKSQCAAMARTDRQLAKADRRLNRLDSSTGAVQNVLFSVTLGLTLVAAGFLVDKGVIGVPGAALVVLMMLGVMEPFAALRRGGLEAGRTWLAARRLALPLSGVDPGAHSSSDSRRLSVPPGVMLSVNDVSIRYPGAFVNALESVSLQVAQGERVAVVGASGSGKSTLIAAITGELAVARGSIQTVPLTWLGQRTDLFHDTLRNNLRLADPDASDDRMWQVLEAAGLAPDVHALDAQLDTHLGEGATGLSGGQARRLALARLLLRSQKLWLLDEPTESLDARTAREVLKQLDAHGKDRGWLLVTHLKREAQLADRLVVLREGQVIAHWRRGAPEFDAALQQLRPD